MSLIGQDVRRGIYQTGPKLHTHNYRNPAPSYRWLWIAIPLLLVLSWGCAYASRAYNSADWNALGGGSSVGNGGCSSDVRPRAGYIQQPFINRGRATFTPTIQPKII